MWGVIAAAALAVAGGVTSGVMTTINNKKLAKKYRQAADDIKRSAEENSGEKLYNAMITAGDDMAYENARNSEQTFVDRPNPGETNNRMAMASTLAEQAAANANAAGQQGRQLGQGIEQSKREAQFDRDTQDAQQMLKQAGIDYKASNQGMQTAMNAAGGLAQLGGQMFAGMRSNKGGSNE